MSNAWDSDFAERSPMFEPLRAAAGGLRGPDWPDCNDLNRLIASHRPPLTAASGRPLRFVAQPPRQQQAFDDKFEPRIYLRGEVQLRPCNWHDLLSALVWLSFPRAKAALNQRHYGELERRRTAGAANRGPVQDTLTLLDEGGVIVVSADAELSRMLADFEWKNLFWLHRREVQAMMRFYLFGHALYEKALQPFVGITGRGVVFEVGEAFFALPLAQQLNALDARLAQHIADPARLGATRELVPVPVLGVPGWCAGNEAEVFYDDIGYFRPARSCGSTKSP